ncbi:hypothetical protein [Flavobacterium coralii]|uniref:hypothetical protein n=1 Tax=Flavobacterium coralii TaxID=2838017 RepID=UPI000C5E13ED|nr:hypothetical protein [Flavobacterium sp.]|tara:strand:- start:221 stop:616 length:396 start_codon:yes stop_codon:yes gene_type:complete
MNIKNLLAASVLCFSFLSCSLDGNDDNCYIEIYGEFSAVTAPATATVNTPVNIETKVKIVNDCGDFKRFSESNSFPKIIKPVIDYRGCECVTKAETVTEVYTITFEEAGEYQLRFPSGSGSYISKNIIVTE